jgi:hypothetical protein
LRVLFRAVVYVETAALMFLPYSQEALEKDGGQREEFK